MSTLEKPALNVGGPGPTLCMKSRSLCAWRRNIESGTLGGMDGVQARLDD